MQRRFLLTPRGITCVYTDDIDLTACGDVSVSRISSVEHVTGQGWYANITIPPGFVPSESAISRARLAKVIRDDKLVGVLLGPHAKRSAAVTDEIDWIQTHLLDFLAGVNVSEAELAAAGGG